MKADSIWGRALLVCKICVCENFCNKVSILIFGQIYFRWILWVRNLLYLKAVYGKNITTWRSNLHNLTYLRRKKNVEEKGINNIKIHKILEHLAIERCQTKMIKTILGCFYVTAILSWGWNGNWGWFELEVEVWLNWCWGWGWDEDKLKFSWSWVQLGLSRVGIELSWG